MAEPFWLRTGKPSPLTFKTFHSGHGWPSQFCVVRSLPTHSRPFLSSLCFPTPSPSIGKDMTISEVGFSPILWSTPSSITILSLDEKSLIHQYQKLLSKLFVASQQSFLLKVGGKISQRERERDAQFRNDDQYKLNSLFKLSIWLFWGWPISQCLVSSLS